MVDRRKFGILTPGLTPGSHAAPLVSDVAQLATIRRVTDAGAWFEAPEMTPGYLYGPAPWSLGSYNTLALARAAGWCPRVGDKAAVMFPGLGTDQPVVLTWWR